MLDISDDALLITTTKTGGGENRTRLTGIVPIYWKPLCLGTITISGTTAPVFHFLTWEEDREKHIQQVIKALKPGGKIIISTLAKMARSSAAAYPLSAITMNHCMRSLVCIYITGTRQGKLPHTGWICAEVYLLLLSFGSGLGNLSNS